MNLFLDIETVPSQTEGMLESILATVTHPGNLTKPETIAKWYAENSEQAAIDKWREQSFDGLYGEIISIAWAFGDENVSVLYRDQGESEFVLLSEFLHEIETHFDSKQQRALPTKWIGHYISGFDLRFIWQRCVVLGVKPSVKIPYDAKPWDDRIFDTKVAWTGASQYRGAGSLDALCKGMGAPGKTGNITGATVFDAWRHGRILEIAEYNKYDVVMARFLYKKLNFMD